MNRRAGGDWPGSDVPKLVDPAIRQQVVALLLRSRDQDSEAAGHIEKALAGLAAAGGTAPGR